LSAGTFVLGNKAAFGTSTVAINGVSVSANTDLNGANKIANATVNLGGNNTFTGSKQIEFSGTVTETASRTVTNNMTANLTFSGPLNLSSNANNNTLLVTGSGNTLLSGVIDNGGTSTSSALSKSGGGILTLTGANTYGIAGATSTTVSDGKLLVNNTSGSGTGPGNVLVNGGKLGGNGNIGGSVSLTSGTVAAGNSIGTLNIGGSLGLTSGTFDWEYSSGTVSPFSPIAADLTNVNGGLNIAAATALSVANLGTNLFGVPGSPFVNGTRLTVISYFGPWNGTFGNAALNNNDYTLGGQTWRIKYDDTPLGTVNGGAYANAVTLTAVPEASTFFVIGLGGIFTIAAVRMGKRLGVSLLKV
jgi:autotransporter-associated beta strand protein